MPRASAFEIPLPDDRANAVLGAVAAGNVTAAVDVPPEWIAAFPQGSPLDLSTFGLTSRQVGRPFPGRDPDGVLKKAKVGDVIDVDGRSYVLTDAGTGLLLDDFSRAVYLGAAPGDRQPLAVGSVLPPEVEVDVTDRLAATSWPEATTTEQPNGELCSLLNAAPGTAPYALLGRAVPGGEASAEGVDPGPPVASVQPGTGALVRSGGWFDDEAVNRVLVDDRGFAYGVAGDAEASSLGYAGVPAEVVPDSWLELFQPGVLLSTEAAQCPPTSRARSAPCG